MLILLVASGTIVEEYAFPDGRNYRSYLKIEKFQPKTRKLLLKKTIVKIPVFDNEYPVNPKKRKRTTTAKDTNTKKKKKDKK